MAAMAAQQRGREKFDLGNFFWFLILQTLVGSFSKVFLGLAALGDRFLLGREVFFLGSGPEVVIINNRPWYRWWKVRRNKTRKQEQKGLIPSFPPFPQPLPCPSLP